MAPSIPRVVADEVNKVLAMQDCGPVTLWGIIRQILFHHKIMYTVQKASPNLFVVHPHNRGKLGVNPFNCHRNGAIIKRVGANLKLLEQATAFELPPLGTKEREVILANHSKIVARSKGLLAPLNGSERFASVGTGHTVQFCKAAIAGCKTNHYSNLSVQL
jgi:hypothetical protein